MSQPDTPQPERLPDAGEPQSATLDHSERPAMLERSFAKTILVGSVVGIVLALATHYLITQTVEDSTKFNSWSWAFAAVGGLTVGGACSLFIYGAATDRSDADQPIRRGQADVSERGEWRRTRERRLKRRQPREPEA
jgi:hypothetical protein